MCYDAAQLAFRVYKEAVRLKASPEEIDELRKKWEELEQHHINYYHAAGFAHPKLLAYYLDSGTLTIDHFYWGLVPHWTKDEEQAQKIWNHTINARAETIFEKPSFRDAANHHRCIIPLSGFYEHYHKNGKTFPYFIREKDEEILFVAGLYADWLNKETGELIRSFSIITTKANQLLTKIHNNPKMDEPRMPLILDDKFARKWLNGNPKEIESIIENNKAPRLVAWTVGKLRGKEYVGNQKQAWTEVEYPELIGKEL